MGLYLPCAIEVGSLKLAGRFENLIVWLQEVKMVTIFLHFFIFIKN
jgi:hypothetical protein